MWSPDCDCCVLPILPCTPSPTPLTFKPKTTLTKNRFRPGHEQKTSLGKYLLLGEQVCESVNKQF